MSADIPDSNLDTASADPVVTEIALPKTPAELIGLNDGQFLVSSGMGDAAILTTGWIVFETGTSVDKVTGQERKDVVVSRPKLDEVGSQVIGADGAPVVDYKLLWLDDLLAIQPTVETTQADNLISEVVDGSAQEVEGASLVDAQIGGTALIGDQISVDLGATASPEDISDGKISNEVLTDEEKQQISQFLGEVNRDLGRSVDLPDVESDRIINNLTNNSESLPNGLDMAMNGIALGALRNANAVSANLDVMSYKLENLFGKGSAVVLMVRDFMNGHLQSMQYAPNASSGEYLENQRNNLASALISQSQKLGKYVDPTDRQGTRTVQILLTGIATGLVNPNQRRDAILALDKALKTK